MAISKGNEQKNAVVLKEIASDLLGKNAGERMTTIVNYTELFGVARGTVQNAIKTLENSGAIQLDTRGHMGTFLTALDYDKLLKASGRSTIFGVMPLPYSLRYEGFVTGVLEILEKNGLDVGMAYMSGADRRLDALLEGRYEFAIVSAYTAEYYLKQKYPVRILFQFSPYTYINDHFLITRRGFVPQAGKPVKIGVDRSSHDQMSWIDELFRDKEKTLVPLQYIHILDHIRDGVIDATVWSMEKPFDSEFIEAKPLKDGGRFANNTAAAIIIREKDAATANCLRRCMDPKAVEEIQKQVMRGEALPNY